MRQDKPLKNKQPCFPYPSFLCFFFSSDLQRTRPRSAPQEELHRRCSAKPVPPPRLAHRRCHVRHPPLRCWSPPVFSSIHQCLRVWHAHAMMSEWMQINRISRYIYIYSYLHYNTHYKYSRYINSDWWQHMIQCNMTMLGRFRTKWTTICNEVSWSKTSKVCLRVFQYWLDHVFLTRNQGKSLGPG